MPEGHFTATGGEGKFWSIEDDEAEKAEVKAAQAPQVPLSEPEPTFEDLLTEFDPRWTDEMEGLLYVGRVSHTFAFAGHTITIATPEANDSLRAALLIKPYQETAGALRAVTVAALATCLVKVDGRPLPVGIMADGSDTMQARFDWVSKLHSTVIDGIYREYEDLEIRVSETVQSLGKEGAPPMAQSIPG